MWKLISSMSDRIDFDRMARESGRDSARVLCDNDLDVVDAERVAREVFRVDLEEGLIEVDDVEEARARFIPAFVQGYEDEKAARREEAQLKEYYLDEELNPSAIRFEE